MSEGVVLEVRKSRNEAREVAVTRDCLPAKAGPLAVQAARQLRMMHHHHRHPNSMPSTHTLQLLSLVFNRRPKRVPLFAGKTYRFTVEKRVCVLDTWYITD